MDATPTHTAPRDPRPRSRRVSVALGALAVLTTAAAGVEAVINGGRWTSAQYGPHADRCPTHARDGTGVYWLVLALIAVGPALLVTIPAIRITRSSSERASVIAATLIIGVLGAALAWLVGRLCTSF